MFEKPSVADLRQAASKLGMNPSDDYLRAAEQIVTPLANAYAALDAAPDELPAGEISARAGAPALAGGEPARRLVREDRDQGQARAASSPAAAIALKDNVCLAGVPMMIGADHPGRLRAGGRRHHRRAHPRCRRRDRRQGGVRVLLRVRRQPHQHDRAGAQSAQARLYGRRLVLGQRRAGRRGRRRHGDRRRPGRLDPHPGQPLRHRRPQADLSASCPIRASRRSRSRSTPAGR